MTEQQLRIIALGVIVGIAGLIKSWLHKRWADWRKRRTEQRQG